MSTADLDIIVGCSPTNPHVVRLIDLLQSEYVGLYGEPDPNPKGGIEKATAPDGSIVLIAPHWGGFPVAVAGWTRMAGTNTAILRRMYVHFEHRRRGYSKHLLEACEESARQQGMDRMVLETGTVQTNAIALYTSMGYTPSEPFGFYADQPTSVFLGRAL